ATDERIERVQSFYRSRGLPVRFQVSPAARPADLDDQLAAAGYEIEAPVDILIAATRDVVDRTAGREWPVSIAAGIDDAWATSYGLLHGDEERTAAYGRLMRTVGPPVFVATAESDGAPVGVGFGVVERGWLGVFGMGTRPDARRQGVARAVLHALARVAGDEGAEHVYLQVEVDNAIAHTLYERAGFTRAYGYHYRVKA
ncbi:MAG: N-acetylglutamate synthase, partial [Actinomycetota bacterium]|nr:N-acetylglutamate synthase [Actinomycetota bacterium]